MAGRGRPQNSQDVAPRIRAAFFLAVENLKKNGAISDISDIWEQMIVTDPFKAFDVLAKFTPKEIDVGVDSTVHLISGDAMSVEDWEAGHLKGPPIETTH